uniref:Protein kinase domain-containing protein n=1 Tax=Pseudo-nitzschia australis TaxID=44445 RepID=A0A7S4EG71_9STRA
MNHIYLYRGSITFTFLIVFHYYLLSTKKWSLGCIMLEITLGFTQEWIDSYDQASGNPATFQKGLECCLSELSMEQFPKYAGLLDILHKCLSINPSRRITSQDALEHSWLASIATKRATERSRNLFQDAHQSNEKRARGFSQMFSERIELLDGKTGFCT